MKLIVLYSIIFMFVGQAHSMRIVHKIQARLDPVKELHKEREYTRTLLRLAKIPTEIYLKKEWIDQIKKCLENGADTEVCDNEKLWTPLLWSVWYQREEIVALLLIASADVHARDFWRRTPLHSAVERGNMSIINMLIKRRANMYTKDDNGISPIDLALRSNNLSLVRYFKKLHTFKMHEIWLEILKQTVIQKHAEHIVSVAYPL